MPEIWRLVTPFLITGNGLGLILDPFFLYQNGSQLEVGSTQFTEPGSFLAYIVFVGVVVLVRQDSFQPPSLCLLNLLPFLSLAHNTQYLTYLPVQSSLRGT